MTAVRKKGKRGGSIYMKTVMKKKISIPFNSLGSNLEDTLKQQIIREIEGKCIEEGFIKNNSISLISHSSALVDGVNCVFEILFNALVCRPVDGMKFKCIVKNITKAGIRAETNEKTSPVVVFIARDHNYSNKYFSTVKQDQIITIKVIGIRYELNDKYISILAELIEPKKKHKKEKIKLSE
jgi:DNA-directed RNA polymerase subunit E'/Rpb7